MTDRIEPKWISALKPGSLVVAEGGTLANRTLYTRTVARLTPTLVILNGGGNDRYRRRDGRSTFNGISGRNTIYEATPDKLANIRYQELVDQLGHHDWHDETPDVLERVAAVLGFDPSTIARGG